jgi:hypothetical protein
MHAVQVELPAASAVQIVACPNCGAEVADAFCPHCGQERTHLGASLRELARDFIDEHVGVDSKILRTLFRLAHPGALTVDYLEGRRTRYVRPLRLYLSVSVLFFVAMSIPALGSRSVITIRTTSSPNASGAWRAQAAGVTASHRQKDVDNWWTTAKRTRLVRFGAMSDAERSAELSRLFLLYMPKMVFALLPIFAVLVHALHRRSGRNYAEHFIFALHLHTFAFLLLTVALLPRFIWPHWMAGPVAVLIDIAYLAVALRRVHDLSWPQSLGRTTLVSVCYLVAFIIATALTMAYALLIA